MNVMQALMLVDLCRDVERLAYHNNIPFARIEVSDDPAWEWEDEEAVGVTAWAGGIGSGAIIDRDGYIASPEDINESLTLVVKPDAYNEDRTVFKFIPEEEA